MDSNNPSINIDILTYIVSFFIAVVGGFLAYVLFDRYSGRISVKLVRSSKDRDIDGFIDVYESRINENLRISPAEIVNWIDEDRERRKVKDNKYFHYLFICKVGRKVAGFLKAMYHSESKLMFVAYFAVDKSILQGRRYASSVILRKLDQLLRKEMKDCVAIVFETEDYGEGSPEEIQERRARLRLFKESARRRGYIVYQIGINYIQPKITLADSTDIEQKMLLLYMPLSLLPPIPRQLSKKRVIDILHFVYMQIYLPTYRHDKAKRQQYYRYLSSLLNQYMVNLPENINLIS